MYEGHGITVALRGRRILDGVDLRLTPGTVTVLVGPNGAGKSTLLKVMAGGLRPTAGEVRIDGRRLPQWRPDELAAVRAVLSQSVSVAFPYRVDEVVQFGLPAAIAPARRSAVVDQALARVGLAGFAGRDCTTLSGGEQQRVHIARTIAQLDAARDDAGTRYLFLDEPTNGLDLAHQMLVVDIAREHAAIGGAVLAVLHDLNLAAIMADTMVALSAGRIVATGAPGDVITDTLLAETYRVDLKVNAIPGAVFVLPDA
jgi:heme transport system ATP-binding protein